LYTLLAFGLDNVTSEDLNLDVLKLGRFRLYAGVLIPLLDALLLLVNFFTDIVAFESIKYWASIMGLCLEFVLFYFVVRCYSALTSAHNIEVLCYMFWLYIMEVSMIGQIVSGVVFMMIRGLVRTKVQLKTIPETKCLPETDALTANKEEINIFSSFMIPLLVQIYEG
jgi:hypothetical protein